MAAAFTLRETSRWLRPHTPGSITASTPAQLETRHFNDLLLRYYCTIYTILRFRRLARGNGIGGSHVRDRPVYPEAPYGDLPGRQPFAQLEQPSLGGEIALQRFAQEIDAQIDGHRERHRPDRGKHRDIHGKIGKAHHGGAGDRTARPQRCFAERLAYAAAVLPARFAEEAALRVEGLGKFSSEETLKLADRHQDRHSPPSPISRTLPRHKLLYAVIPGPRASERSQESITTSRAVATRRMNHRLGLWIPGSLASR